MEHEQHWSGIGNPAESGYDIVLQFAYLRCSKLFSDSMLSRPPFRVIAQVATVRHGGENVEETSGHVA